MQTLDMKKENYLKAEPTITLNPGTIKCLSNIPSGYCMVVDTPGQVPYRPGGTSHYANYNTAELSVKGDIEK